MAFARTLISSALNIHALWKWVDKNAHFSSILLGLAYLRVGQAFTGTALNKHPCIEEVGNKKAHFFTVARLIVASRLPWVPTFEVFDMQLTYSLQTKVFALMKSFYIYWVPTFEGFGMQFTYSLQTKVFALIKSFSLYAHKRRPDRAEGPLHVQESKLDRAEGPLYVQITSLTTGYGLYGQFKANGYPIWSIWTV